MLIPRSFQYLFHTFRHSEVKPQFLRLSGPYCVCHLGLLTPRIHIHLRRVKCISRHCLVAAALIKNPDYFPPLFHRILDLGDRNGLPHLFHEFFGKYLEFPRIACGRGRQLSIKFVWPYVRKGLNTIEIAAAVRHWRLEHRSHRRILQHFEI